MLPFYILALTLSAATFKIQQLYMVLTLCLRVLYGSHNKERHLTHTILANWFCIMEAQSVNSAVRSESL